MGKKFIAGIVAALLLGFNQIILCQESENHHVYVHGYDQQEAQRLLAQGAIVRKVVYNNEVSNILTKAITITEVGSGSGTNIIYQLAAFPNIRKYSAIDIEQEKYAQNMKQIISEKKLSLLQGNIEDFNKLTTIHGASYKPLRSSQDVVFGTWVLEHSANPQIMLRQAYNILKPGGYLIFTEYSWDFTNIELSPRASEDKAIIAVINKFNTIKKQFTEKQLLTNGNPFYASTNLAKDLAKTHQAGDKVTLRLLDMSPGANTSFWQNTATGKTAAR